MIRRLKATVFPLALLLMLAPAACAPQRPTAGNAPGVTTPASAATAPAAGQPRPTGDASGASVNEAAGPPRFPASKYADLEIVTLLPPDAIPAIDDPVFLSAVEADAVYDPDELVIGVVFDGDARAYSVPFLSGHEIVNDTVGGRKIAITW